jgi:hypothetical protein
LAGLRSDGQSSGGPRFSQRDLNWQAPAGGAVRAAAPEEPSSGHEGHRSEEPWQPAWTPAEVSSRCALAAARETRMPDPRRESAQAGSSRIFAAASYQLHFLVGGIICRNRLRQLRQRFETSQHIVIFEHRQILILHSLRFLGAVGVRHVWRTVSYPDGRN